MLGLIMSSVRRLVTSSRLENESIEERRRSRVGRGEREETSSPFGGRCGKRFRSVVACAKSAARDELVNVAALARGFGWTSAIPRSFRRWGRWTTTRFRRTLKGHATSHTASLRSVSGVGAPARIACESDVFCLARYDGGGFLQLRWSLESGAEILSPTVLSNPALISALPPSQSRDDPTLQQSHQHVCTTARCWGTSALNLGCSCTGCLASVRAAMSRIHLSSRRVSSAAKRVSSIRPPRSYRYASQSGWDLSRTRSGLIGSAKHHNT